MNFPLGRMHNLPRCYENARSLPLAVSALLPAPLSRRECGSGGCQWQRGTDRERDRGRLRSEGSQGDRCVRCPQLAVKLAAP
jgi:hypothetical protein